MDFNLHDPDGVWVGIIEEPTSAIWTRAYYKPGDFELYLPASVDLLTLIEKDCYITRDDDDSIMIVERLELETNDENGDFIIIKGRTANSLLDRRIVWNMTTVSGRVDMAVYKLINDNAISPTDTDRILPIIMDAPNVLADKINAQHTGTGLLDAVNEICAAYGMGHRAVARRVENGIRKIVPCIELFVGKDRSAGQTAISPVIFSPEYENVSATNYAFDMSQYKNVALVAGEGEGTARTRVVAGAAAGLERRELYVDARDLGTDNGAISATDYAAQLNARGVEKLTETRISEAFSGDVDTENTFVFRSDYDVGDIVTVENEYGIRADARIVSITESWGEGGQYSVTPTFEGMEA